MCLASFIVHAIFRMGCVIFPLCLFSLVLWLFVSFELDYGLFVSIGLS